MPSLGPPTAAPPPSQPSEAQGGIVVFPPTSAPSSSPPRFTAPVIVPTMGEEAATNPVTNAPVSCAASPEAEVTIPNFEDDAQMCHYTMAKLQKTLLDVQHRLKVGSDPLQ